MNWRSKWIFDKREFDNTKRSVLFRKKFVLDEVPEKAEIMVSAETRYCLYVNGIVACRGPLKGDSYRKYYETCDIAPYLKKGENILAARVLYLGLDYFGSVDHYATGAVSLIGGSRGGFLLHSEALDVDTDESWKVKDDESYHFVASVGSGYAGDQEYVDGEVYPTGWESSEYDESGACGDSGWKSAAVICPSDEYHMGGLLYEWQLTPSVLPLQGEESVYPKRITRKNGDIGWEDLLEGKAVTIPAHTECFADIDVGELSTCFLAFHMENGEAAELAIRYSECYCETDEVTGGRIKKDRNNFQSGDLYGEEDKYRKGKGRQTYRPFFYRTFRYIRLQIKTGEEPLVIRKIDFRMTGYPLDIRTEFSAGDPQMQQMWDISVRTLKRCMHETYEDCPYYEQMQYMMDTNIQMSLSYCLSGDDRLARKALYDFHSSQRPDGMLTCNFPASFRQIIPGFALQFPDMVLRHYQYFGDKKLLSFYLPTILRIFEYFEARISEDTGLVKDTGYWTFVDWVDAWRNDAGSPLSPGDSYCYLYSQMYGWALLNAAAVCRELGYFDLEQDLKIRHAKIVDALNRNAVDPESGLFLAKPGDGRLSQHAQVWAVLSECVTGERAAELMRTCIRRKDLLVCSYSMSFFLFRAMEKAGVYEESAAIWEQWKCLLDLGITTWPEDNVGQRSECHAWSAGPIYELIVYSLGIRPQQPGYAAVRLEPCEFGLGDMKADVWTGKGIVKAERRIWTENGQKWAWFQYLLPEHTPVHVKVPGKEYDAVTDRVEEKFIVKGIGTD